MGRRNLVRVRNVVLAAIFDFMTSPPLLSLGSFNMALSRANCALKENERSVPSMSTASFLGFFTSGRHSIGRRSDLLQVPNVV